MLTHTGNINSNVDLKTTIESGQTFLWNRDSEDKIFTKTNKKPKYVTTRLIDDEVVVLKIKSTGNSIEWQSTHPEGGQYIKDILNLNMDYERIQSEIIKNDLNNTLEKAIKEFPGLRVVTEPLYPTLISFICSTQMRVERIHKMVQKLCENFGQSIVINGSTYHAFPRPYRLAQVSEEELKDIKLGYRARYVKETSKMIADEPLNPPEDIDECRNYFKQYMGVGDKVADCVLLYGCGKKSVVPVDTWIDKAVNRYYPELKNSNKSKMAREIESMFGENAGIAQAYLFHYMRINN